MPYLKSFIRYARWKIVGSLGLGLFLGMTEGVGLFMLMPLMSLIGIGGSSGSAEGVTAAVGRALGAFGVTPTLASVLGVYVALIAGQSLASRAAQVVNAELVAGYTCYLQNRIYATLAYADWVAFLRLRGADIAHVLSADTKRVGFVTQQLLQLLGMVILSLVYIAVALTVSVPMTLAALACGAILVCVLRPFDQRAKHTGKIIQSHLKQQFSEISEHLAGMKVAKSFGLEQRLIDHFETVTQGVAEQQIGFSRINAKTKMYYQVGSAMALSGFFYGAVTWARIDAAGMLLLVFLFARLLPRFSQMQLNCQQISYNLPAFSAADKMYQYLAAIMERTPNDAPGVTVDFCREIRFEGVGFHYGQEGGQCALEDIHLAIPAGKMTAVVGLSGAGKSSLADLLLGLLSPTAGTISIDGQPLDATRLAAWRRMVGYVPQDSFLFNDTIRANLQWACPQASEEAMRGALALASADAFVANLPQGFDTLLGDRGVRLSGGERQRIALARALLREPSLLLLDEATSSLDAMNEKRIQEAIAGLHGKITLVVIAHRLTTIRAADNIVVLDQGKVVEAGDWESLAAMEDGYFQAMLRTSSDFPRNVAPQVPAAG